MGNYGPRGMQNLIRLAREALREPAPNLEAAREILIKANTLAGDLIAADENLSPCEVCSEWCPTPTAVYCSEACADEAAEEEHEARAEDARHG